MFGVGGARYLLQVEDGAGRCLPTDREPEIELAFDFTVEAAMTCVSANFPTTRWVLSSTNRHAKVDTLVVDDISYSR